MDGSTVIVIAMVAMMALMCGGMIVGSGWALVRRRKRRGGDYRERSRANARAPRRKRLSG